LEMKKTSVENLKIKDLKHVLLPLKRGRLLEDYIDIGFDTEFTAEPNSADRELISLQFSLGRGKMSVYYINRREGISSEELLSYALKFLNEQGVEPRKHVYLISHFAIAELSKINDFYKDYEGQRGFKVRPKISEFNKAMRWEKSFGEITLHIADLFGHMKTSLEKIGSSLSFEKFKLEVNGKDHAYWIANMKELQDRHPNLYEAYAMRDAEIAIEAWRKIVEQYKPLNIDPHLYTTYTSLAVAAFRRQMKRFPCKTSEEKVLSKQVMKGGKWREHVARKIVYDGDFRVRVMAALSYWGGNNQAFVRGYLKGVEGTYYDFISLYIIAGILQPLSSAFTQYKELKQSDVKDGAEGFAEVDFSFPLDEEYPCLPVQEDYYQKLMFPLSGKSYCTLTELRQALDEGVKLSGFHGYGFFPDENEIEHDLKPFLINMLQRKSAFDETAEGRKSIEREIEKAKMVGIIGRLAYMKPSRTAEDITRLLHESSLELGKFREYGKRRALRELTTRSEVGGTWHIEWASLILGKARSMAAWAVKKGEKCLSISTDGGFWLGDPKFENTELHKKLAVYHSGIRYEGSFDELFIARNRVYVASLNGKVLHSAMMGIAVSGSSSEEKKANFEDMIRKGLTEGREEKLYDSGGKEVYEEVMTRRLTGLNDYFYEGVPLNSVQLKAKKINWKPDYKRKLINADVKIFKDWTDTAPYETVDEAFRQAYGVREKVGRPKGTKKGFRGLTNEEIEQIRKASDEITHRELAEKHGVSVSTVKRVRQLK